MRNRAAWLVHRLLVLGAMVIAGGGSCGCASLVGEQNADASLVMPGPGGPFDFKTQTVIEGADVHSANRV
ncbi:MAG TPA: hypothetical protein VF316_13890, partial [Polyangiaceae bacterium]